MSLLIGFFVQLLGALSVIIAIATGLLGGFLFLLGLSGGSGGFILNNLGVNEALVVFGAGNLVCLILNAAILALRRGHPDLDWLRNLVVRIQLVPAALFIVGGLLYFGILWRNINLDTHAQSIEPGLSEGQASAVAAFKACTGRCQRTLSPDDQLLIAAEHDRFDWATLAMERGGRLRDLGHVTTQRRQPVQCDNDVTVPYANALELAIIHDNPALINLLLPLTARPFMENALYTAVVLGREAATRQLLDRFGWTALPQGLETLSRRPDGKPMLIIPDRPLSCDLPSWEQRGWPLEGR